RWATAQQTDFEPSLPRPDEPQSVADEERLRFAGHRADVDGAVGQHPVDVEKDEADASGTFEDLGVLEWHGKSRHRQTICVRQRSCRWTTPSTIRSSSTTTTAVILRSSMSRSASTARSPR